MLAPGGKPLPRAEVRLLPRLEPLEEAWTLNGGVPPEPAATTLADAGGRFVLTAPAAGLLVVRVEAGGFAPLELELIAAGTATDLVLE